MTKLQMTGWIAWGVVALMLVAFWYFYGWRSVLTIAVVVTALSAVDYAQKREWIPAGRLYLYGAYVLLLAAIFAIYLMIGVY